MLITVNGPPVLDIPDEFTFSRNDSIMVSFRNYVEDPELDTCSFSFTGNSGINITPYGWSTVFSAPNGFVGSETITITVNDGHNAVQDSFVVNVINHAPELNLPADLSMDQNGSLTVDFASYLSDPDGDIPVLSYSGNSNIDVSIDGYSVTFTPLSDWFGSELITFMLSDGLLEVNSAVQLTVNQVISHLDTPELQIISNTNGIVITWQPIENATEYWIYRANEPDGSYSLISTSTTPQYWDNDPPEKAFYYVKAVYLAPTK